MNYNDHAPPHVHVKYQRDVGSYRIEIMSRMWMQSGKKLPPKLLKLVEAWVEAHEEDLLAEWENAQHGLPVRIIG